MIFLISLAVDFGPNALEKDKIPSISKYTGVLSIYKNSIILIKLYNIYIYY
jgi:hypothetical protein